MVKSDAVKLEAAVIKMIEETVASGKTLCLFDQYKLLQSLQVSSLKIRHISSEISDILSGAYICNKYGLWATGEHESDVRYMVRLTERRQPIDNVSHFVKHEAVPRAEKRSVYSLEVPKGISEEQAQQFLEQACAKFLNTATMGELIDEDLRKPRTI